MSEVQVPVVGSTEVSTAPVAPVVVPQKMNAIQLIEHELMGFIKQREQAVANVHAIEGAIQAAQHLLGKLRAEFAKAEAEASKVVEEAENFADAVEQQTSNVIEFVKKEL